MTDAKHWAISYISYSGNDNQNISRTCITEFLLCFQRRCVEFKDRAIDEHIKRDNNKIRDEQQTITISVLQLLDLSNQKRGLVW